MVAELQVALPIHSASAVHGSLHWPSSQYRSPLQSPSRSQESGSLQFGSASGQVASSRQRPASQRCPLPHCVEVVHGSLQKPSSHTRVNKQSVATVQPSLFSTHSRGLVTLQVWLPGHSASALHASTIAGATQLPPSHTGNAGSLQSSFVVQPPPWLSTWHRL